MANEGRVRTIAIDARGCVWAAGDDICVLEPDARGLLQARSVIDQLPPDFRSIGSVLHSARIGDRIAFANVQSLFVFPATGAPFVIPTEHAILQLCAAGDTLFVSFNNGTLGRLEGD